MIIIILRRSTVLSCMIFWIRFTVVVTVDFLEVTLIHRLKHNIAQLSSAHSHALLLLSVRIRLFCLWSFVKLDRPFLDKLFLTFFLLLFPLSLSLSLSLSLFLLNHFWILNLVEESLRRWEEIQRWNETKSLIFYTHLFVGNQELLFHRQWSCSCSKLLVYFWFFLKK